MRNESVPEPFKEPGTPSLYAVCGRDFSKIRNKGRIVPLAVKFSIATRLAGLVKKRVDKKFLA
jgi:hypothetical protein